MSAQMQSNFLLENHSVNTSSDNFSPFSTGHLDIQLPTPNKDIRLFVFHPAEYPYLWIKYLEGVQREYKKMGVAHILDIAVLSNPHSSSMAMLTVIDGEIAGGMRFHGRLRKTTQATVLAEMADGNPELLAEHIDSWLPDGIMEPKGLWVNVKHPARKRLFHVLTRAVIYGAVLKNARYSMVSSSDSNIRMHIDIGVQVLDEMGEVKYPTEKFTTKFCLFDTSRVLGLCHDKNKILLQREWNAIQHARSFSNDNISSWQPIILDPDNPFHAQGIESLLNDTDYKQVDIDASVAGNFKTLLPPLTCKEKEEGQRWVVYPWRKSLLKVPGPRNYKRLREDRNHYKITVNEQQQLSRLNIGVIGLSTGHVIAHTLAMEGLCGHLRLIDFDQVEITNLNRIPVSLLDVGANKAVVTAKRILEINPYMGIEIFEDPLTQHNMSAFMSDLDMVIEQCDSLDIKLLVREAASRLGIPVIMATSDLGMIDIERFDLNNQLRPLHGLVKTSSEQLADLSIQEKSAHALDIVEGDKLSPRLAATMTEIGNTVETWPQLASDVIQGAALVATAVRRIGTGKSVPTGRMRSNMDAQLQEAYSPQSRQPIPIVSRETLNFTDNLENDMLLAASQAPSAGNLQPWTIYWQDNQLHFEIDRQLTGFLDIKHRAAMLAIGAACLNAEIVAAHHKRSVNWVYFPDDKAPDLVARLELTKNNDKDNEIAGLYKGILSRTTNRNVSKQAVIPAHIISKFQKVSKDSGLECTIFQDQSSLDEYADIIGDSDRYRYICKHLHAELMNEIRFPGKDNLESGIDVRTLGIGEGNLNILDVIRRDDVMEELAELGIGHSLGDYNRQRISGSSAILCLKTRANSDAGYLSIGRVMQYIWLLAEDRGLAVHPISPIFLLATTPDEIDELMQGQYLPEITLLQQRFRKLFAISEQEYSGVVIKLGYAEKATVSNTKRPIFR